MQYFRFIYPVLLTVLELTVVIMPMLLGIFFLFRKTETYEEKHKNSVFSRIGMTKKTYIIIFRSIGILCILISFFAIWRVYIYEDDAGVSELKEFWKEIDTKTEKNMRLSEKDITEYKKDFFVCL